MSLQPDCFGLEIITASEAFLFLSYIFGIVNDDCV